MKKILFILLITGQMIMATSLEKLNINGLEIPIIYEKDSRLPIVGMQFIFTNSGSITDLDKKGLAKFSAKMMNEGTKELGSIAFAESLESKAIQISSSSGKETFVLEIECLKEEFDYGLRQFNSLLKNPNFSEDAIRKVRANIVGSLSHKINDFDYVASNALKSIIFKNTPLANPTNGTIESVKSIELQDIENFIKEHLVSSRLIVVLGGDIEFENIKETIIEIIKSMPIGKNEELKYYRATENKKTYIIKKETEQAYVYFGAPLNLDINSDEVYKSRVAGFILGAGGFGSRLMEEIRVKRGLAYSVNARYNIGKSSSVFSGYLQTKLESLDEAKETVQKIIKDFVKNGVSAKELSQTKKFLLGSEPLRVETISQRLSRAFMEYYSGKGLGNSKKELKLIKNLSLKDLNKFIKEHKEITELSFAIVTK